MYGFKQPADTEFIIIIITHPELFVGLITVCCSQILQLSVCLWTKTVSLSQRRKNPVEKWTFNLSGLHFIITSDQLSAAWLCLWGQKFRELRVNRVIVSANHSFCFYSEKITAPVCVKFSVTVLNSKQKKSSVCLSPQAESGSVCVVSFYCVNKSLPASYLISFTSSNRRLSHVEAAILPFFSLTFVWLTTLSAQINAENRLCFLDETSSGSAVMYILYTVFNYDVK